MVGAGGTQTCVHPHVSRLFYHCATDNSYWGEVLLGMLFARQVAKDAGQQVVGLILHKLTLKVLVATIDAQLEGMGDVGSTRYEPV